MKPEASKEAHTQNEPEASQLENGKIDSTVRLMSAARTGNVEEVRKLLGAGADPSFQVSFYHICSLLNVVGKTRWMSCSHPLVPG
jgi:hypothetical protein